MTAVQEYTLWHFNCLYSVLVQKDHCTNMSVGCQTYKLTFPIFLQQDIFSGERTKSYYPISNYLGKKCLNEAFWEELVFIMISCCDVRKYLFPLTHITENQNCP